MTDNITQDVHEIVDGILKQKEEVAMRKEIEEALNKSAKTISELSTSLEAKDTELSNLEATNEELELSVSTLSSKAEEVEKNLESIKSDAEGKEKELTDQLEASQKELEDIKKDQLAKARFEDLTNEGVAVTDDQATKDQITKIREMQDEEFELYKTDRIELRKSVIAELEASAANAGGETTEAEAVAEETDAEETGSEEDEGLSEEEAKAKLEAEEEDIANSEDSIDPMKAVAAMLNIETVPTSDILTRYRELGSALAENVKNKGAK